MRAVGERQSSVGFKTGVFPLNSRIGGKSSHVPPVCWRSKKAEIIEDGGVLHSSVYHGDMRPHDPLKVGCVCLSAGQMSPAVLLRVPVIVACLCVNELHRPAVFNSLEGF